MFENKLIALDIGNNTIKVVYGYANNRNIIINEYDIIKMPVNCMNDGIIINIDELAKVILYSLKKNKMTGGSLVLNVTGTRVITRDIQIPSASDQEIEQILEFEAQQYFPVDLQNYTVDFKVLERIKTDEGEQLRVLIVAAPNKQVEEFIQLSKLLKKPLKAIDLPANCVLKILSHNAVQNVIDDGWAVVDIGKDTSLVCIFRNNTLKFNRILLNGSAEIDQSIANKLNVEYGRAEEFKTSFSGLTEVYEEAAATGEAEEIGEIIKNSVNNIITDVNRFIDFYNSRESQNHVQKIYLYGGGSKLKGLPEYFTNYFNMPVTLVPLQKGIIYKGRKGKKVFEEDFNQLINAIGGLIRT